MGILWGMRAAKEKYEALRRLVKLVTVVIDGVERSKLTYDMESHKTSQGGISSIGEELKPLYCFCPNIDEKRCIDLDQGLLCGDVNCMANVFGLYLKKVPINADENVFLTCPRPSCPNGNFQKGRMGINTVARLVPEAMESIGVNDVHGHGCRAYYLTKGFELGCPMKILRAQARHKQVATTEGYQTAAERQLAAVSDAIATGQKYAAPAPAPAPAPVAAEKEAAASALVELQSQPSAEQQQLLATPPAPASELQPWAPVLSQAPPRHHGQMFSAHLDLEDMLFEQAQQRSRERERESRLRMMHHFLLSGTQNVMLGPGGVRIYSETHESRGFTAREERSLKRRAYADAESAMASAHVDLNCRSD